MKCITTTMYYFDFSSRKMKNVEDEFLMLVKEGRKSISDFIAECPYEDFLVDEYLSRLISRFASKFYSCTEQFALRYVNDMVLKTRDSPPLQRFRYRQISADHLTFIYGMNGKSKIGFLLEEADARNLSFMESKAPLSTDDFLSYARRWYNEASMEMDNLSSETLIKEAKLCEVVAEHFEDAIEVLRATRIMYFN